MRRSKNNSSVCQTTTLITLSDISYEPSQTASLSSHCHQHLIDKVRELEEILAVTKAEQSMLRDNQKRLREVLEDKKKVISGEGCGDGEDFSESVTEDFARTWKIDCRSPSNKGEYKSNRQSKNHKFYSAIQSPTLRLSPEHAFDTHGKSRYCPESTISKATGTIRKQHRQSSQLYSVCDNYKSIEDIWNQNPKDLKKYPKQKPIRSFL